LAVFREAGFWGGASKNGYLTIVGFFTGEEALKLGPLAVDAVKTISKEAGHMMFWQRANNLKNSTKKSNKKMYQPVMPFAGERRER